MKGILKKIFSDNTIDMRKPIEWTKKEKTSRDDKRIKLKDKSFMFSPDGLKVYVSSSYSLKEYILTKPFDKLTGKLVSERIK